MNRYLSLGCYECAVAAPAMLPRFARLPLLLALIVSAVLVSPARALDLELFNGMDLTGWTVVGPVGWTVEDGVIRNTGPANDGNSLRLDGSLAASDFSLEMLVRIQTGTRMRTFLDPNGVYFGNEGSIRQFEIYGNGLTSVTQTNGDLYETGDWYLLRVDVDATNRMRFYQNNVETHEATVTSLPALQIDIRPGDNFSSGMIEIGRVRYRSPIPAPPVIEELVPWGAEWKFLDNGTDQGEAWRNPGFDDGAWASGLAELGYGDGDEATRINCGPTAPACNGSHFVTSYFRKTFQVTDNSRIESLTLELLRDDGAAVYLNGVEVARKNLFETADYLTLANEAVGLEEERYHYGFIVPTDLLVEGDNVLAVEMHQSGINSTDVSFDLRLTATVPEPASAALGLVAAFVWIVARRIMSICRRRSANGWAQPV
jgi:hypothetical protein